MLDFISFDVGGIPVVFWAAMVALVLTMNFMAQAAAKNTEATKELSQVPVLDENQSAEA